MSENTERDELATIIERAHDLNEGMASFELLAHATLAAGYRKPRTITTVEELDALTDGSVIRDNLGVIRERFEDPDTGAALWYRTASSGWALSKQCRLPATVLHEDSL